MSFWTWLTGAPNHAGITPNENASPATPPSVGVPDYSPGDPDGFMYVDPEVEFENRSFPSILPSPWDGWPAEWNVPNWDFGSKYNHLVDVAWSCLDKNSRALSTMPVNRVRSDEILSDLPWMENPDPTIYSSWDEFAKQAFWDFQGAGEVFIWARAFFADGYPMHFRVLPPWSVHVEMRDGVRQYRIGGPNGPLMAPGEMLHIRYKSTTGSAHGCGPLEAAGQRMVTAGVLANYVREVVQQGGIQYQTLETDQDLDPDDAQDLMHQYVTSRLANASSPPVFDKGLTLKTHTGVSPRDMAMLEISQATEGRIADLLGLQPFQVGLPSGDSMTYSNVSQVFDQHWRSTLRTLAVPVMKALSHWALPRGQVLELDRDDYTRPPFKDLMEALSTGVEAGIFSQEEARTVVGLSGAAPEVPSRPVPELTGGEQ